MQLYYQLDRGEKEITSLNQIYLKKNKLQVAIMNRGMTWMDTGTIDALDSAIEFVRVIEKRTNKKIACVEEIAYLHGFISKEELLSISKVYQKSGYGEYLKRCVEL